MSQLYSRVFLKILDSSIAEDWQTRHVFEDILKLTEDGICDVTRESFARRCNIPLNIVNAAIDKLESPDPASRDDAEDGRRLIRLDNHRNWGWKVVNWEKFEAIKSAQDQRERTRERVRRFRERTKSPPLASPPKTPEATSEAEAEAPLPKRYLPLHSVTRSAVASPTSKTLSDEQWLDELKKKPAYEGIDVPREYSKMLVWCENHDKQPTRNRFLRWLNKCDPPMAKAVTGPERKQIQENIQPRILA